MSLTIPHSSSPLNSSCVNLCIRCLVDTEKFNDEIIFKSPIHCSSCHTNFQPSQIPVHAAIVQALIERDDAHLLQLASAVQHQQTNDGRIRGISLTLYVPTPCPRSSCDAVIESVMVRVVCDVERIDDHVIASNVTLIEVIDPNMQSTSSNTTIQSPISTGSDVRSTADIVMSSAISAANGAFNSMKSMLSRPVVNQEQFIDGLLVDRDECKKMFFALLDSAERNVQLHIQSLNDFTLMQAILHLVQREVPMQVIVNAGFNTDQTRPFLHSLLDSCVDIRIQTSCSSSGLMMLIIDNQRVLSGHFSCDDPLLTDDNEEEVSLVLCSELDVVKAFQMKFIQTLLHESSTIERKLPMITDAIVISEDRVVVSSCDEAANVESHYASTVQLVEPCLLTHQTPITFYGSHADEDNINGQLLMSHLFAAIRDARSTIHVMIHVLTLDLAVMLRSSNQSIHVAILADDSSSNRDVWQRIQLYDDQSTSRDHMTCHFVAGPSSRTYDEATKSWVVTHAPMRECLMVIDGDEDHPMVITGSALYTRTDDLVKHDDELDDDELDDTELEQAFDHLIFLPVTSFAQKCLQRFRRILCVSDELANQRGWDAIGVLNEHRQSGTSNRSVFDV